ncbi:hypothetical protein [Methanimicrococcus hacksteinii]|uniref:hypothetical protein n=1 Tax=Methanimicrococcus hacksteinii TaxID=3028293 RepID=UPI00298F1E54|nr:hypothetical protein [Methanimicrococcus sp. At1]
MGDNTRAAKIQAHGQQKYKRTGSKNTSARTAKTQAHGQQKHKQNGRQKHR